MPIFFGNKISCSVCFYIFAKNQEYSMSENDRFLDADEIGTLGFVQIPLPVLLDKRITASAKVLYGILKRYARGDGICYPGVVRLSNGLGISQKTVQRKILELTEIGLIERRGRRGTTNFYYMKDIRLVYGCGENKECMSKETAKMLLDAGEARMVQRKLTRRILFLEHYDKEDPWNGDTRRFLDEEVVDNEFVGVQAEDLPRFEAARSRSEKQLKKSEEARQRRIARKVARDIGPPQEKSKKEEKWTKNVNMRIVETEWKRIVKEKWPSEKGAVIAWGGKEFGLARGMFDRFRASGLPDQEILFALTEVLLNWEDFQERYGIESLPKINIVYGYSETWFPEVWNNRKGSSSRVVPRTTARKMRQFDESKATDEEKEGGVSLI